MGLWKSFHLILMHFFFFNALRKGYIKFFWFSKIHFFYNFDQSSLFFDQSKLHFKNFSEPLPGLIDRTCFSINRTSWIKFFLNTVFYSFKTLFQIFLKLSSLSPTWQGSTEDFLSFSTKFFARFFSPKAGQDLYTPPFSFIFMISCINSCILMGFSELFTFGIFVESILFF